MPCPVIQENVSRNNRDVNVVRISSPAQQGVTNRYYLHIYRGLDIIYTSTEHGHCPVTRVTTQHGPKRKYLQFRAAADMNHSLSHNITID